MFKIIYLYRSIIGILFLFASLRLCAPPPLPPRPIFVHFHATGHVFLNTSLRCFGVSRINKLYIKSKCIEVYEGFRTSV